MIISNFLFDNKKIQNLRISTNFRENRKNVQVEHKHKQHLVHDGSIERCIPAIGQTVIDPKLFETAQKTLKLKCEHRRTTSP